MATKINNKALSRTIAMLLFILLIVVLALSLYYNRSMERQIEERDELIKSLSSNIDKLKIKEDIFDDYFDIQIDSTNTLKAIFRGTDSLQMVNVNELKQLSKSDYANFSRKYKTVLDSLKAHIEVIKIIEKKTPIRHNISFEGNDIVINVTFRGIDDKYNTLLDKHNNLLVKYTELEAVVNYFKNQYQMNYKIIDRSKEELQITISSPKIDSAMLLLKHYKDRLHFNKETNEWTIGKY